MRPIPKMLLIHNATLQKATENDRWGNATLSDEVELLKVRFEPSGKVVRDKNNQEIQLAATLIYDCVNSRPRNFSFEVDQIVSFNGQLHQIVSVEPLYDERKLHHYEMGLVCYAG